MTQQRYLPMFVSSEAVPLHQKQRQAEFEKIVTCRVDETEWGGEHSVWNYHHDLWLPLLLGSTKYWYLKERLRGKNVLSYTYTILIVSMKCTYLTEWLLPTVSGLACQSQGYPNACELQRINSCPYHPWQKAELKQLCSM